MPGKRTGRRHAAYTAALAVVAAILLAAVLLQPGHPGSGAAAQHGAPRALIVDGLAEAYPNPRLLEELRELLSAKGYQVEVVTGRDAGLNVFSGLTGYQVVVMRLHGGYMEAGGRRVAGLFTGVPWSTRFLSLAEEGLAAEGIPVYPPPRGPRVFLALLPRFFEERLEGRFPERSVIVAGGCYTGLDPGLVEALCRHGLSVYIGFAGRVRLDTLDRVLPRLAEAATGYARGEYGAEKLRALAMEKADEAGLGGELRVFICRR